MLKRYFNDRAPRAYDPASPNLRAHMIQLRERAFGYFLIQCADEERGELLNVGVVAYDPEPGRVECRVAGSLDRVQKTLPNVPVAHVRLMLENAQEAAERALRGGGVDGLAALSENPRGTLRFTPLRSIRATHLEWVADELLLRYVEMPNRKGEASQSVAAAGPVPFGGEGSEATSRRVISAVETRLRRYRFSEGSDYERGVTVRARLAGSVVPIWFPLRFKRTHFLDAIEVRSDLNRTLDHARAVAQKIQEARSVLPQARVNVLIRDPGLEDDGRLAQAVLQDSAGGAEDYLSVDRYSGLGELDVWMERTLQPLLM